MQNFFKIFELEEKYDLDKSLLDSKYFTLLAKYHPDKARNQEEKIEFLTLSTMINNGYKTLTDDFERAAHILEIHGINIKNDILAPKLPAEILEEILEMHEKMELATSVEEKQRLKNQQDTYKKALLSELKTVFRAKDFNAASMKTMHLRYL